MQRTLYLRPFVHLLKTTSTVCASSNVSFLRGIGFIFFHPLILIQISQVCVTPSQYTFTLLTVNPVKLSSSSIMIVAIVIIIIAIINEHQMILEEGRFQDFLASIGGIGGQTCSQCSLAADADLGNTWTFPRIFEISSFFWFLHIGSFTAYDCVLFQSGNTSQTHTVYYLLPSRWVGGRVKQKQLSTSQAQIKSLATIVVDRDMLFLVGRHRVLVFSLLTSCLNLDFDLIFLKEEARVEKIFWIEAKRFKVLKSWLRLNSLWRPLISKVISYINQMRPNGRAIRCVKTALTLIEKSYWKCWIWTTDICAKLVRILWQNCLWMTFL